jgi:hypothetical protein
VCVVLVGGWKVNGGDEGEGMWLMGFIYIHKIEWWNKKDIVVLKNGFLQKKK